MASKWSKSEEMGWSTLILSRGNLMVIPPLICDDEREWTWQCDVDGQSYSDVAPSEREARSAALHCYYADCQETVKAITTELENFPWGLD